MGELGPGLEGPGRRRVTALSRAGKAHLKRAILGQEEALRLHAVCRALRRVDLLQVVLAQALRRSLAKYSELDLEDDFCEAAEAPDVRREQPGPLGGCVLAPGGGGRRPPGEQLPFATELWAPEGGAGQLAGEP